MDNTGVFGTFGRKTLAIMLICIGDGIRDSLIKCFVYGSVHVCVHGWFHVL